MFIISKEGDQRNSKSARSGLGLSIRACSYFISFQMWSVCSKGHPKMSTLSWVYKQYTFSDPLPPPLQVYRPTFVGSSITIIVQQLKLIILSSLLWLSIRICKCQIKLYTSKFNLKIFLVGTKLICSISQYKI